MPLATSLRINPTDLARIDQLAQAHGLSRNRYMIDTALGRLNRVGLEQRIDELEETLNQRIQRLEDLAFNG
jgi:uncharacterized protein (DUF1778 family)